MKGGTLQIIWHDSLPVLSLDFHIDTKLLATAGADHDIKLWTVAQKDDEKGSPFVVFKANLSFHTTAVNVIRFSPSGELLASGADGGHLALWKRALNADSVMTWKVMKQLRAPSPTVPAGLAAHALSKAYTPYSLASNY